MSTPRVLLRSICSPRASSQLRTFSFAKPIPNITFSRQFTVTVNSRMPESLKSSEVNSQTDPSVAKQYDNESPKEQQIKDLFNMIDGKKIGMLNTYRNGVGRFNPSTMHTYIHTPYHPSTHNTNNNPQAP